MRTIKTYSELMQFDSFIERYRYLKITSKVGEETFGYDRYLNQEFYTSPEWRAFRQWVITRDMGCDLGIRDREIGGIIIIHHIVPITMEDIVDGSHLLLDPENVICVSDMTHKAIHYGNESLLIADEPIRRTAFDTCPWKRFR